MHVKSDVPVEEVARVLQQQLRSFDSAEIAPRISDEALEGLTFSECLPPERARAVLERRLADPEAVSAVLGGFS